MTISLNVVEYATGWLESRIVSNSNFSTSVPLFLHIFHTFGIPKQIISDDANCFRRDETKQFQRHYRFIWSHKTPARPQRNGKVEQANGILKGILIRIILDICENLLGAVLASAITLYNRRVSPSRHSLYFLLFGTQPPEEEITNPLYTREATEVEELD